MYENLVERKQTLKISIEEEFLTKEDVWDDIDNRKRHQRDARRKPPKGKGFSQPTHPNPTQ